MIRLFIFLFIFTSSSYAIDSLPNITVKGSVCHNNQRINIHTKIKAKSKNYICNFQRSNPGSLNTSTIAHSYTFWGNTNSGPRSTFFYSFPLMDLLIDRVEDYINNGVIKLPAGYSILRYIDTCEFKVTQVAVDFDSATVNDDTYVVIRDSFFQNGNYPDRFTFDVSKGETHTLNFPFELIEGKQTFIINVK